MLDTPPLSGGSKLNNLTCGAERKNRAPSAFGDFSLFSEDSLTATKCFFCGGACPSSAYLLGAICVYRRRRMTGCSSEVGCVRYSRIPFFVTFCRKERLSHPSCFQLLLFPPCLDGTKHTSDTTPNLVHWLTFFQVVYFET